MLVGSLLLSRAYNSSISTQCCHVINAMYSMNGKILQFFSLSLRPVAALYLITYLFKHLVLDVVVAALVVSFFSFYKEGAHTYVRSKWNHNFYENDIEIWEKKNSSHFLSSSLYDFYSFMSVISMEHTQKKRENIIKYWHWTCWNWVYFAYYTNELLFCLSILAPHNIWLTYILPTSFIYFSHSIRRTIKWTKKVKIDFLQIVN